MTLKRKHDDTTNYRNPQTNRGRAHWRNVRLPHALLAIRFCLILIGGCSTLRWPSENAPERIEMCRRLQQRRQITSSCATVGIPSLWGGEDIIHFNK